ncbi:adhesion G-protein coupled receptor D2 isoform X6 [Neoarius graeffei]|uniref:adhesion G-protein coupled receptor D2 isoform X6 n=1 Tax=Neoarius graeffei TaxID=443677 RepID=UPI00298C0B49|nr:adhesion G-protein coupled receptor D2 isoform X6 [Neoarius graeffei]
MCGKKDKEASHYKRQKVHRHIHRPFSYGKMSPVLLMAILSMFPECFASKTTDTSRTENISTELFQEPVPERCIVDSVALSNHSIQTPKTVFQLVNATCSFIQAFYYCQSHFTSLTIQGQDEDEKGMREVLAKVQMHHPVWVENKNKLNLPSIQSRSKQNVVLYGLSFPNNSKDGYARLEASFPPLSAVSVCIRAQFNPHNKEVSTLFSYAAPTLTNEFQLRGCLDKAKQQVLLALIIHGKHQPYKAWFPNNGDWHQICVTWRRIDGLWNIYVDGKKRDSASDRALSRDIYGNGIFILGQDQDSFGGNFTEPFFGNMTDLNIWPLCLSETQIWTLFTCSPASNPRPFFRWHKHRLTLHTVVKEISARVQCPGLLPQKEQDFCQVLSDFSDGGPKYSAVPCTTTHPFICKINNGRYQKKKQLEDSLISHPTPFMQNLMKHGMNTSDILGTPDANNTWSGISCLLNVSESYLRESQGQLEDRDLPSLLGMLSRVAELPTTGNQNRAMAHTLSLSAIDLADMLMSENIMDKWEAVKEVIGGPMAVVQTIDHMSSNLSPLLLGGTDHVQINSSNIRLQVKQLNMSESSPGPEFCGFSTADPVAPDCISIPPQSMQELQNKGFGKVTLLNVWYGSLRPVLNESQNISVIPTSTDSSFKYKKTVLGSSLISCTVIADGKFVSIGVQFTLHHQTQSTSGIVQKPICAFWDFELQGQGDKGGWSTDGCKVISSQDDMTSCHCNHTTNFALLLQIYEVQRSPEDEAALEILSFIGCGVSLCGLIFTFILFVAVSVPKSDRTTVHKNLIVALAAAQFLLIFSNLASTNQEVCLLVTALLHLFFLASFCWMLVEGLLLWSKVVSVNISEDRRMKFYYALGWGLPVVIVSVTLSVSLKKYKAEQHCWLNIESDIIWTFVGPVLFVLTVNTVVLCRVVMVTISSARRRAKMLAPSSASKSKPLDLTWAATRPVLILMPVLGLTWLCGVLVHLSVVLAYLFIALNAFQGLYIFLVYAVYNSEVKSAIKRIQEKRKALSFTPVATVVKKNSLRRHEEETSRGTRREPILIWNCSQPVSFLPSQRTLGASWVDSLPTPSSPESSSSSYMTNSTASSLVIKNESFGNDKLVSFSLKPTVENPVVQLMAFKPSV